MKGKPRTNEEKHELFEEIKPYLEQGLSLRKSCNIANIPYTSMRDIISNNLLLRTKMTIAQSSLISKALSNVKERIEAGDIKVSQWYIERVGTLEPLTDPYEGGNNEKRLRVDSYWSGLFGDNKEEVLMEAVDTIEE